VGARVYDLATFLVDVLGVVDVGARFPHSVTYHDGCHGRRELASTNAAVALLRGVHGIDYRELPAVDECCGFGGLFSVKFEELSASMGAAKCEHALSTGADYLVSGDSSCLMHIGGMLGHRDAHIKTMHLAEVLACR
jgi:L-lactate dehydrogenase complex protein LldE